MTGGEAEGDQGSGDSRRRGRPYVVRPFSQGGPAGFLSLTRTTKFKPSLETIFGLLSQFSQQICLSEHSFGR